MALYYLETSALVKLYVMEPGSDRLLRLVNEAPGHVFAVLTLAAVEVRSAIRRRERAGDIHPETAGLILDRLGQHLQAVLLQQAVNDAVLDAAAEMIDRYALRAYDAFQLAGCLALKVKAGPEALTFVCSDQELLEAARSELLPVFDPVAGP